MGALTYFPSRGFNPSNFVLLEAGSTFLNCLRSFKAFFPFTNWSAVNFTAFPVVGSFAGIFNKSRIALSSPDPSPKTNWLGPFLEPSLPTSSINSNVWFSVAILVILER